MEAKQLHHCKHYIIARAHDGMMVHDDSFYAKAIRRCRCDVQSAFRYG